MSTPEPSPTPQPLLSVLMPVYNESRTLRTIVRRVLASPVALPIELVCVDDGSRDESPRILDALAAEDSRIRVFHQPGNMGKGAAIRRAIQEMHGDIGLIQDADLEYDPRDIPGLVQPILDGNADVVFGSRFIGSTHRVLYFWHMVVNRGLTLLSNMFNDLNLTDIEICYKAFTRDVAKAIVIEENRFGVEPELTAKVAKMRLRIYEVPVSYRGRTYEEGKKIGLKDAFTALYCILRYWKFD